MEEEKKSLAPAAHVHPSSSTQSLPLVNKGKHETKFLTPLPRRFRHMFDLACPVYETQSCDIQVLLSSSEDPEPLGLAVTLYPQQQAYCLASMLMCCLPLPLCMAAAEHKVRWVFLKDRTVTCTQIIPSKNLVRSTKYHDAVGGYLKEPCGETVDVAVRLMRNRKTPMVKVGSKSHWFHRLRLQGFRIGKEGNRRVYDVINSVMQHGNTAREKRILDLVPHGLHIIAPEAGNIALDSTIVVAFNIPPAAGASRYDWVGLFHADFVPVESNHDQDFALSIEHNVDGKSAGTVTFDLKTINPKVGDKYKLIYSLEHGNGRSYLMAKLGFTVDSQFEFRETDEEHKLRREIVPGFRVQGPNRLSSYAEFFDLFLRIEWNFPPNVGCSEWDMIALCEAKDDGTNYIATRTNKSGHSVGRKKFDLRNVDLADDIDYEFRYIRFPDTVLGVCDFRMVRKQKEDILDEYERDLRRSIPSGISIKNKPYADSILIVEWNFADGVTSDDDWIGLYKKKDGHLAKYEIYQYNESGKECGVMMFDLSKTQLEVGRTYYLQYVLHDGQAGTTEVAGSMPVKLLDPLEGIKKKDKIMLGTRSILMQPYGYSIDGAVHVYNSEATLTFGFDLVPELTERQKATLSESLPRQPRIKAQNSMGRNISAEMKAGNPLDHHAFKSLEVTLRNINGSSLSSDLGRAVSQSVDLDSIIKVKFRLTEKKEKAIASKFDIIGLYDPFETNMRKFILSHQNRKGKPHGRVHFPLPHTVLELNREYVIRYVCTHRGNHNKPFRVFAEARIRIGRNKSARKLSVQQVAALYDVLDDSDSDQVSPSDTQLSVYSRSDNPKSPSHRFGASLRPPKSKREQSERSASSSSDEGDSGHGGHVSEIRPAAEPAFMHDLSSLVNYYMQGFLTKEEFVVAKQKLIGLSGDGTHVTMPEPVNTDVAANETA